MTMLFLLPLACSEPTETPVAPPVVEAPAPEPPDEEAPISYTAKLVEAEAVGGMMSGPAERPRVYNFWATWCAPCVAELPILRDFAKGHPDVEVVLVSVDVPSVNATQVAPFLKKHDLGPPLVTIQVDSKDSSADLTRVIPGWADAVPVTYVVKADGTRAKTFQGALGHGDLEAALELAR